MIKGFEVFADGRLRSEDDPCPEGEWPQLKVLSLNLRMTLCSREVTVECAEIIFGS